MRITLGELLAKNCINAECEIDKISGIAYALENLIYKLDEEKTEELQKKNWLALINISAVLQEYINKLCKDISELSTFTPIDKTHFQIVLENK